MTFRNLCNSGQNGVELRAFENDVSGLHRQTSLRYLAADTVRVWRRGFGKGPNKGRTVLAISAGSVAKSPGRKSRNLPDLGTASPQAETTQPINPKTSALAYTSHLSKTLHISMCVCVYIHIYICIEVKEMYTETIPNSYNTLYPPVSGRHCRSRGTPETWSIAPGQGRDAKVMVLSCFWYLWLCGS